MADNNKDLISNEVLQKATQDILQTVVEHVYDYEEYSDEFISDLFQLTPEEAKSISEIINDEVVSKYKLWSSQGTTNKINEAKLECQNYSNELIKDLSSISLEWCETSLPTTGEHNKIYILPVASGGKTVNTLNIWNSTTSAYVSIGNLEIDITTLYTKSEIDTMLADYAKKTEVLSINSVITNTSLATGANVLSASTSMSELNKKVDKTSITTTIDNTSTNNEVVGAKAVYEKTKNMCTTTVADVSETAITLLDTTNYEIYQKGFCYYSVINGIAYVQLYVKCINPVTNNVNSIIDLPKSKKNNRFIVNAFNALSNTYTTPLVLCMDKGGKTWLYGGEIGSVYLFDVSYPVA